MSNSEIAHLRTQISLEYEASCQALHGLASGTAQHEFITRRLERMAEYHQRLAKLVGEEQAIGIVYDVWEGQSR